MTRELRPSLAIGLVCSSLLFLSQTAVAQASLKFNWTTDLVCRVEQRSSTTGGSEQLLRFNLQTASAKDYGLYVETSLPELRAPGLANAGEVEPAEAAFMLATKLPSFHIGAGGSLLGLKDAGQARQAVRDSLAAALPVVPSAENLDQMVGHLATQEVLENQVSNFWNATVEQWLGKELSAKPMTGEAETTIDGSTAPLKVTATLERSRDLSCKRGGKERQCAELIASEVPEPANLREVMRAILGAEGAAEIDRIKAMSMHTRTVTITEPDTLIPQLVTVIRTIKITRDGPEQETVEQQSWKFDCD